MLPLLRKGGAGCITATSNLVARSLAHVYKHFRDGDDDPALKAAQARIVKARELVSRFPQMASLKALVAERTGHAGWQRLRPPLESLPPAQMKELLADAAAFASAAV
jgi:4-hydroxy-tetrahydrodipicolinate synthase